MTHIMLCSGARSMHKFVLSFAQNHTATRCNTLQHTATCAESVDSSIFYVLQCLAVFCSVLQCSAVCCNVLQCAAVYCSVLQCAAMRCSVLQCAAASLCTEHVDSSIFSVFPGKRICLSEITRGRGRCGRWVRKERKSYEMTGRQAEDGRGREE